MAVATDLKSVDHKGRVGSNPSPATNEKMRSNLFFLSKTSVLLALSLALIFVTSSVSSSETVSLQVDKEAVYEDSIEVSVNVDDITNFDAGQFNVVYNRTVLSLEEISDGNINGVQIPVAVWNPETDIAILNVPEIPGVSGAGVLAVLSFDVIGKIGDVSEISLDNGFLNDNEAVEIVASWIKTNIEVVGKLGDCNSDGELDYFDIVLLGRIIVLLEQSGVDVDLNKDGFTNVADITTLERFLS